MSLQANITPNKTYSAIFTDASKEGWGTCINERTARGTWSLPGSKLHINYLELKAVFLALKGVPRSLHTQIVFVETDNTTVVSYINKEGSMRSGPLGALLWRILTWCTRNQVDSQSPIPSVCGSRQANYQARPDHLDSDLSFMRSSKQYMQQVASASNRSIGHRPNNKSPLCLQHQIP